MRLTSNWNLALIFLLTTLLEITLASPVPSEGCAIADSNPNYYSANATLAVVEPWRGEHNVYALFVVPQKYAVILNEREAIVRVKGIAVEVNVTAANPSLYRQVEVPEDSSLLVSYLWTREAIWQILRGKYAELQQSCSWTLYIRL